VRDQASPVCDAVSVASAWDCHVHVFDPAFPFAPVRAYTPPPATPAELQQHLNRIGAGHAVLVQASPHGDDNSGLLDALDKLGPQHRAVIAPAPGLDAPGLRRLRDRGVRGLRLNPMGRIDAVDVAIRLRLRDAARLAADAGLALELSATTTALATLSNALADCPCEIVVPHLAGLPAADVRADTTDQVRDLIVRERIWVKLSGFDRYPSEQSEQLLMETVTFLTEAIPDRLIWGSDWPHTPFHSSDAITDSRLQPLRRIDDARQKATLSAVVPAAARDRIFSCNPAKLYG